MTDELREILMHATIYDQIDALVRALRIQRQIDENGVEVAVSRESVDMAIKELLKLRADRDEARDGRAQNWQNMYQWMVVATRMRNELNGARLALNAAEAMLAAAVDERDAARARAEAAEAKLNAPELIDFREAVVAEAAHQRERWGTDHDAGKTPADWFWLVGYLAGKALAATKGEALPRYRHVKYGTTYEVIAVVENENNRGQSIVVYRGESDGKRWARPAEQFFDGRFEELPAQLPDKLLHHIITTAAACANWHAHVLGKTNLRPGIAPPPGEAP
jgi:hypothetical protein